MSGCASGLIFWLCFFLLSESSSYRSASLQRLFVWKLADYSLESHTKEFLASEQMLAMLRQSSSAAL